MIGATGTLQCWSPSACTDPDHVDYYNQGVLSFLRNCETWVGPKQGRLGNSEVPGGRKTSETTGKQGDAVVTQAVEVTADTAGTAAELDIRLDLLSLELAAENPTQARFSRAFSRCLLGIHEVYGVCAHMSCHLLSTMDPTDTYQTYDDKVRSSFHGAVTSLQAGDRLTNCHDPAHIRGLRYRRRKEGDFHVYCPTCDDRNLAAQDASEHFLIFSEPTDTSEAALPGRSSPQNTTIEASFDRFSRTDGQSIATAMPQWHPEYPSYLPSGRSPSPRLALCFTAHQADTSKRGPDKTYIISGLFTVKTTADLPFLAQLEAMGKESLKLTDAFSGVTGMWTRGEVLKNWKESLQQRCRDLKLDCTVVSYRSLRDFNSRVRNAGRCPYGHGGTALQVLLWHERANALHDLQASGPIGPTREDQWPVYADGVLAPDVYGFCSDGETVND